MFWKRLQQYGNLSKASERGSCHFLGHIIRREKLKHVATAKILEWELEEDSERRPYNLILVVVWEGVSTQTDTCCWRLQDVEKQDHLYHSARHLMIKVNSRYSLTCCHYENSTSRSGLDFYVKVKAWQMLLLSWHLLDIDTLLFPPLSSQCSTGSQPIHVKPLVNLKLINTEYH